ncbi:MAG: histidine--tRNA ligase [Puniceicoccales bacterium]|jgi:histidyl-tRNA synthetase|nr:histidine--tRNA ligase [Puniceicoccales bacterium]
MFSILPGFRDFYPADCAERNYIFQRIRDTAKLFGFEEYDGPVLEPLELFTEKSGQEIVSQLFSFTDKGGRQVAMRPEMTPSLARMVGSKASSLKRPIKWFDISELYRYERPQKGRLRSFYQFNADIFGESDVLADAESMALLISVLRSFGLTDQDFHIKLSSRKLWSVFFQLHGIPMADSSNILNIIDKSDKEPMDIIVGKLDALGLDGVELLQKINEFIAAKTVEEIYERLANCKLFTLAMEPLVCQSLEDLSRLLEYIEMFGLQEYVVLDMAIVRGLAYYTGFVFEAFERLGKSRALAGGGRYDDLTKKMGYAELPAVGFAIGDVTLANLLSEKELIPNLTKSMDVFMVFDDEFKREAMGDVILLRNHGLSSEFSIKRVDAHRQLKMAAAADAKIAIIYSANVPDVPNFVLVRRMSDRKEVVIARSDLLKILDELLK